MSSKRKLSNEILGLFAATGSVSIFFFGIMNVLARSVVINYCDSNQIILNETAELTMETLVIGVSLVGAILLFITLFLFLLGQKLSYLTTIIQGIHSLRMHRMDYEVPVEGNNELTELAESINYLAKTERELALKEKEVREEKEALIRALSHDIRTPLTSILAYSEFLKQKGDWEKEEIDAYIRLMQQKATQIKGLTDSLLDGEHRNLEHFENGTFLMQQLAEEWEFTLEEEFTCSIHMENCPEFSADFDVQELRRIFDNLASNVKKYADAEKLIELSVEEENGCLLIEQKNYRKQGMENVESYKIGLENIKSIARRYNGKAEVSLSEEVFLIRIIFRIL